MKPERGTEGQTARYNETHTIRLIPCRWNFACAPRVVPLFHLAGLSASPRVWSYSVRGVFLFFVFCLFPQRPKALTYVLV